MVRMERIYLIFQILGLPFATLSLGNEVNQLIIPSDLCPQEEIDDLVIWQMKSVPSTHPYHS